MTTKFFSLNQIYSAQITSSSENAQFPLSNLKDDRRTKTFRTTSGSGWIVFDFGEAIPINSFLTVDNNLLGFNLNSLTFQVNNSNTWGSPLYSSTIDLDLEHGIGFKLMPSTITARYARLEFTSLDSYCELSKVFIGANANIQTDVNYPVDYEQNNLAKISKNRFGQRFIDEIISQKKIKVSFSALYKEEMTEIFELLDFSSITRPVWIVFDSTEITENNNRLNGMYYLTDDPQAQYISGNFWSLSLSLEEAT